MHNRREKYKGEINKWQRGGFFSSAHNKFLYAYERERESRERDYRERHEDILREGRTIEERDEREIERERESV